jgi:hypothetical protein
MPRIDLVPTNTSDASGLHRGFVSFKISALRDYEATSAEITGARKGPKMLDCVRS